MKRRDWIVCRPPPYRESLVPLAVLVFALWMGWSVPLAIGLSSIALLIVVLLTPRRPGRWTE